MVDTTGGQPASIRFAVIGLGGMGVEIVRHALDQGYELTGAVDIGDKVGRPVAEFVDNPHVPGDLTVSASIEDVLVASGKPEVVVLAASIGPARVTDAAVPLLEQGINVLTLEAALFDGLGELAERIDAAGKAGGASFLATGIQDTWWVHLPAVAAGANKRITKVVYDDHADISFFPESAAAYEAGVGLSDEEFAEWRDKILADAPVQGGPLSELARLLGFTPGPFRADIQPVRQDTPQRWPGADRTLEAGEVIGAHYFAAFDTAEGVPFEGNLTYRVMDGPEHGYNSFTIHGDAVLEARFPAYASWLYVSIGLVRRIPDIITAPAGIARVRDLPAPRYVHPVR